MLNVTAKILKNTSSSNNSQRPNKRISASSASKQSSDHSRRTSLATDHPYSFSKRYETRRGSLPVSYDTRRRSSTGVPKTMVQKCQVLDEELREV